MSKRQIGGYLKNIVSHNKNLLFRTIVIATLFNAVFIFSQYDNYLEVKSNQNAPNRQNTDGASHNYNNNATNNLIVIPVTEPKPKHMPTNNEASQKDDEGTEFLPSFYGYRVKITDFLLALFTFLLWWSTQRLVKGAERTARVQLRAYIGVTDAEITIVDDIIKFSVFYTNCGQTPAINVIVKTEEFIQDTNKAVENILFKTPFNSGSVSNGTKHSLTGNIDSNLWIEYRERIENGSVMLMIVGNIYYEDIFKKHHYTNYRFFMGGRVGTRALPSLAYSDKGNDSN